jgi:hypothetical protein
LGFEVVISEGMAAIQGIWSDERSAIPAWVRRLSAWRHPG